MRWTEALQGVRVAVFLNILHRWESAELNQAEAADLLGVSERTFRRWRDRSTRRFLSRRRAQPRPSGRSKTCSGRTGCR